MSVPAQADIVIVGAGVAGLYCAWRLLADEPSRSVLVVDLLDRIGGRLDTDLIHIKSLDRFDANGVLVPGRDVEVKEEEGGMRFNATMTELLALIEALGMWDQINRFGMGDDNNLFHIRGRSFTAGESKRNKHALWSQLYNLEPNEQNKSPGEIVMAVYRDLVYANGEQPPDNPTPEFWQTFRLDFEYNGIKLNQWGLWSLLRAFGLSPECVQMLADTSGFQAPFYSSMSAGSAYQLLEDFPLDPIFYALEAGFGSLPVQLAAQIEERGGTIALETRVTQIDRTESGYRLAIDGTGGVACRDVILSIPPVPLRKLLDTSPDLALAAGLLDTAMTAVVPMRLCKVNLYYTHAWWRDHSELAALQVSNGGSFTTQPMGSVYVFDPMRGQDATGPAALTIYCDWHKTEFWAQLQDIGPMFDSALQREHSAVVPQVLYPASAAIVTEATVQLRELFGVIGVPRPVLTSYRMWSGDHEFGHAYHQWARGADDRAVIAAIANPMPRLFVCNEAFSDDQGWVNGSLRSADLALAAGYGLGRLTPATRTLPAE